MARTQVLLKDYELHCKCFSYCSSMQWCTSSLIRNGCLCCSVKDNGVAAIENLMKKRGKTNSVKYIPNRNHVLRSKSESCPTCPLFRQVWLHLAWDNWVGGSCSCSCCVLARWGVGSPGLKQNKMMLKWWLYVYYQFLQCFQHNLLIEWEITRF